MLANHEANATSVLTRLAELSAPAELNVDVAAPVCVVLLVAFFAHITIAAAHIDRPPAGRLVLVLFSISTTLALWQLAMHTKPYNGGFTCVPMPAALEAQTTDNAPKRPSPQPAQNL